MLLLKLDEFIRDGSLFNYGNGSVTVTVTDRIYIRNSVTSSNYALCYVTLLLMLR